MAGHEIVLLTEPELRAAAPLDLASVEAVQAAFAALAGDGVVMPPILSMALPGGHDEVDVKTAYLPGFDRFAVKISTGFYGNAALGLPSLGGLMVVLSARTGQVEAVLLDNGYLTDLRTAAAGAVAARHLAPGVVKTAGVFGTGLQARLQMRAAHLVRPFDRVLVWGRNPARAAACAADLQEALGVVAEALDDPAPVVAQSQLVVTTTPSRVPLLEAEWLHPGLHITAMGSDAPEKGEIAPAALASADLYVADRVSQAATLGELRSAREAGHLLETPPELSQIVTGRHAGRVSDAQVTIADLTGTGAQDTAIAVHVLRVLQGQGAVIRA